MKRSDRIRLNFIRNWTLPGKERLSHWFKPSDQLKTGLTDGITWLTKEDIAIYTTADSYIEWTILNTGTYEDEIGKLIHISLTEGDNALDIGANIGLQSLRMAERVGDGGKVYAFEPLEHLGEKFRKNIALNKAGNVTLFPCALADEDKQIELKIDRGTWNQGSFSLNTDELHGEIQKVIVRVADNIPELKALDKLAFIKIDVEGFEYHVIRGLNDILQKHRPRIVFEYDANYWVATGQSIADCFSYLTSMSYTIYQVSSVGCELINTHDDVESGNLFCIPFYREYTDAVKW